MKDHWCTWAPSWFGWASFCISFAMFEEVSPSMNKPGIPKAPRVQQRVQTHLELNLNEDSELEDPVEAGLAEDPTRWGQARKDPSWKADVVAAPGSAPGHSGLSRRSLMAMKSGIRTL